MLNKTAAASKHHPTILASTTKSDSLEVQQAPALDNFDNVTHINLTPDTIGPFLRAVLPGKQVACTSYGPGTSITETGTIQDNQPGKQRDAGADYLDLCRWAFGFNIPPELKGLFGYFTRGDIHLRGYQEGSQFYIATKNDQPHLVITDPNGKVLTDMTFSELTRDKLDEEIHPDAVQAKDKAFQAAKTAAKKAPTRPGAMPTEDATPLSHAHLLEVHIKKQPNAKAAFAALSPEHPERTRDVSPHVAKLPGLFTKLTGNPDVKLFLTVGNTTVQQLIGAATIETEGSIVRLTANEKSAQVAIDTSEIEALQISHMGKSAKPDLATLHALDNDGHILFSLSSSPLDPASKKAVADIMQDTFPADEATTHIKVKE